MSHFYNTGVCDSDVMSHFPAFIYFPMLHQYRGTEGIFGLCFLPLVSLIEIPASPTVEQPLPGDAPLGPAVYPGEESTHSERCPPKLASHRAWETGAFPSPCSIAQGLYPRESFHHSLSAIHKQLWHTHMHTHKSLAPLLHIYIFIFRTIFYYIDISHRLWCFFTLAVSNGSFSAKRAVQYGEVTACLTCHCWLNKGVRYDTCPCYGSFVHFRRVSKSLGTQKCEWQITHDGKQILNVVQEPATISH